MKCRKCGVELNPEALFCSNCGSKVETKMKKRFCRECGAEFPEGAKFCISCGTAIDLETKKSSETANSTDKSTLNENSSNDSEHPRVVYANVSYDTENIIQDAIHSATADTLGLATEKDEMDATAATGTVTKARCDDGTYESIHEEVRVAEEFKSKAADWWNKLDTFSRVICVIFCMVVLYMLAQLVYIGDNALSIILLFGLAIVLFMHNKDNKPDK